MKIHRPSLAVMLTRLMRGSPRTPGYTPRDMVRGELQRICAALQLSPRSASW